MLSADLNVTSYFQFAHQVSSMLAPPLLQLMIVECPLVQEPGSDSATNKRQHLGASAAGACEAGTSINAAAAGLGKLPNEVLLHVLHMAARPLSAWLAA